MIITYNQIRKEKDIYRICKTVFDKTEYHLHIDGNIETNCIESLKESSNKTIKTDVDKKRKNKGNQLVRPEQTRVLVAESNDDLRYPYRTYLDSLGLKLEIANSGEACLSLLFKDKTPNNNNFDTVVINTHLIDIPGLDVAKEIRIRKPYQRIAIVTTRLREHLPKEQLGFAGIDNDCILTIPFRFSDMVSVLNPNRNRNNNQ